MKEIKIPGQEMEKAAAEITTAAGKSIVKSLGRIVESWSLNASAGLRAKSEQTRLDSRHAGDIRRAKKGDIARHEREFDELDHLQRLALATGRFKLDLLEEQERIEYISNSAILIANESETGAKSREIEDDWLRIFFKYAAQVSEKQILDVLSQALAEAADAEKPVIPSKALDAIRFFDKESIEMFKFCANQISRYGSVNDNYLEKIARKSGIKFDLDTLQELDLIKYDNTYFRRIRIGGFYIVISHDIGSLFRFDNLVFTKAGKSIAGLLNNSWRNLSDNYPLGLGDIEFWEAQEETMINELEVKIFATSLISEICDLNKVEFELFSIEKSDMKPIYSLERSSIDEPFNFPPVTSYNLISESNRKMVEAFLGPFEIFDKSTAGSMKRNDI